MSNFHRISVRVRLAFLSMVTFCVVIMPILIWSSPEPSPCRVTDLKYDLVVEGEQRFPDPGEPIVVKPSKSVTVKAEIITSPSQCDDSALSLEWLMSFTSNPSRIQIITKRSTRQDLEMIVGQRPSQDHEEDDITMTARDPLGTQKAETIRIRVKGE